MLTAVLSSIPNIQLHLVTLVALLCIPLKYLFQPEWPTCPCWLCSGGDVLSEATWNSPPESRVSQVTRVYGGAQRRFSSCWSKTNGTSKQKNTKKELPYKSRKAWRQNLVTRVRTDWFHVRLLNSVSVWRRHWPSVDGCTSQESCWVTSNACDCRRTPVWGPSMADPSWWWS